MYQREYFCGFFLENLEITKIFPLFKWGLSTKKLFLSIFNYLFSWTRFFRLSLECIFHILSMEHFRDIACGFYFFFGMVVVL